MGGWVLFFRKFSKKICGICIMGFVTGLFLAFIVPPVIIVITEGILLVLLCWLLCAN